MKIISNGKRKGWIFSKIETATCLLRMQVRFLLAGVRQTAIATVGTLQNWDSDNTFLFAYLFWWQNRSFWSCVWDKRKPVCGRDYNREAEKRNCLHWRHSVRCPWQQAHPLRLQTKGLWLLSRNSCEIIKKGHT